MQPRSSRLPALMLAGLLVWPAAIHAQTTSAATAPAIAAPSVAAPTNPGAVMALTQARQALDVLQDDKQRAALITTLRAIAATAPTQVPAAAPTPGAAPGGPAPGPTPGPTPAAKPAAPAAAAPAAAAPGSAAPPDAAGPMPAVAGPVSRLPLEPDSLVAQLISQVSGVLVATGAQLVTSLQSVNDLPLLWRWLVGQANDPAARAAVLDALWKLAVVLGAGLAVDYGCTLLLGRVRRALSRGAQSSGSQSLDTPRPPPDMPPEHPPLPAEDGLAAAEAGETERAARAHRLSGAIGALRRLPFLFGRLLLDLVPIAAFAIVTNILLGTPLGDPAPTRATILLVVQCYLAGRLVLQLTAMLVSPAGSQQRLLHISDWSAEFLSRWVRRLTIAGLAGFAIATIGVPFGMYRTASDALLKLAALVVHVYLVFAILEARIPVARRIGARHNRTGAWATTLNRLADVWHLIAIFYVIALWLVWAVELRNGYVRLVHFFLVTVGIGIAARLVAVVLLGGLDRARGLPALASRVPGFESRATFYYPFLRSVLLAVIAVATGIALLEGWGFGVIDWFRGNGLGGRAVSATVLIGTTVFVAVVVWEGANAAINLHLSRLGEQAQLARAGRLRTLLPMLRTVLLAAIVLVVLLMTLDELGVNIAPLLAGAGVVGIAVGFGSQKLVQDLITGLFLLLENAMQVGDVVTLAGLSGTVEALSIRAIRLRAIDGSVHIIPFSAVTTVTNQTRDYGYAVVDVSVGLNEEPERIVPVLKAAAEAMRKEPRWQNIVLEPLDVLGVEKFIDLAWVMRVRMKTQPASRWAVARELNRRIKETFDAQGIESPFTSHRALSETDAAQPAPTTQEAPA